MPVMMIRVGRVGAILIIARLGAIIRVSFGANRKFKPLSGIGAVKSDLILRIGKLIIPVIFEI